MLTQEGLREFVHSYVVNFIAHRWDAPNINEVREEALFQVLHPCFDVPDLPKEELAVWAMIEAEECCWVQLQWPKLQTKASIERWSVGKMHSILFFREAAQMKERVVSYAHQLFSQWQSKWEHLAEWWMVWVWSQPRTIQKKKWFGKKYDHFLNKERTPIITKCRNWYYSEQCYTPIIENPP